MTTGPAYSPQPVRLLILLSVMCSRWLSNKIVIWSLKYTFGDPQKTQTRRVHFHFVCIRVT